MAFGAGKETPLGMKDAHATEVVRKETIKCIIAGDGFIGKKGYVQVYRFCWKKKVRYDTKFGKLELCSYLQCLC
jgi:hypothetical protein